MTGQSNGHFYPGGLSGRGARFRMHRFSCVSWACDSIPHPADPPPALLLLSRELRNRSRIDVRSSLHISVLRRIVDLPADCDESSGKNGKREGPAWRQEITSQGMTGGRGRVHEPVAVPRRPATTRHRVPPPACCRSVVRADGRTSAGLRCRCTRRRTRRRQRRGSGVGRRLRPRIERGECGRNEQASSAQPQEIDPPIEEEAPACVSRGSERRRALRSPGRQGIEVCVHEERRLQAMWGMRFRRTIHLLHVQTFATQTLPSPESRSGSVA